MWYIIIAQLAFAVFHLQNKWRPLRSYVDTTNIYLVFWLYINLGIYEHEMSVDLCKEIEQKLQIIRFLRSPMGITLSRLARSHTKSDSA